jgi:hypothetical protein
MAAASEPERGFGAEVTQHNEKATRGIGQLTSYQTVEAMVLEQLQKAILHGVLKPGERLKQDEVAASMGVSKTPVQYAFKVLQTEGYIITQPHRTALVSQLSPEEAEEIYAARMGLEPTSLGCAPCASRWTKHHAQAMLTVISHWIRSSIGLCTNLLGVSDYYDAFGHYEEAPSATCAPTSCS